MKSFIQIILLLTLMQNSTLIAQIGINTTTPHPSSILEVYSDNKGMLVPKVPLRDVLDTTLDGTNPAAEALLIYNTNPAISGGDGVGFYFFNGAFWEKLGANTNAGWDLEGNTATDPTT